MTMTKGMWDTGTCGKQIPMDGLRALDKQHREPTNSRRLHLVPTQRG